MSDKEQQETEQSGWLREAGLWLKEQWHRILLGVLVIAISYCICSPYLSPERRATNNDHTHLGWYLIGLAVAGVVALCKPQIITSSSEKYFITRVLTTGITGGAFALLLPIAVKSTTTGVGGLRHSILLATGGLLAILTLGETRRKNDIDKHKNDQEKDKNDKDYRRQVRAERRERYTKAVEQLGDEKAPVRMGGVYTLVGLVDEWLEDESIKKYEDRLKEGQVIINNLCAYIRSPFPLAARYNTLIKDGSKQAQKYFNGPESFYEDKGKLTAEIDVRLSIIKEIHNRIYKPNIDTKTKWSDFEYDFSGSIFFYPVDMVKSHYKKSVDFSNSSYYEKVNFEGSIYEYKANFSGSVYSKESIFSTQKNESRYHGEARFDYSIYSIHRGNANFSKSTYNGEVYFENSIYKKDVSFSNSTYNSKVIFNNSIYKDAADFGDSKYHSEVYFDNSTYENGAIFKDSRYTKVNSKIDFSKSTYTGKVDFHNSNYGDEVSFSNSSYNGPVSFNDSTYEQKAYFNDSIYTNEVSFKGSTYKGKITSFRDSIYMGKAIFGDRDHHSTYIHESIFINSIYCTSVIFSYSTYSKANFQKSLYIGWTDFAGSTYGNEANFSKSIYGGIVDFTSSTYEDKSFFNGSIFYEKVNFSKSGGKSPSKFVKYSPEFYNKIPSIYINEPYHQNTLFGSRNNEFSVKNGRGYPIYKTMKGIPLNCKFLTSNQKNKLKREIQKIENINKRYPFTLDAEERKKLLNKIKSINNINIYRWCQEATEVKPENEVAEDTEN